MVKYKIEKETKNTVENRVVFMIPKNRGKGRKKNGKRTTGLRLFVRGNTTVKDNEPKSKSSILYTHDHPNIEIFILNLL